MQPVLGLIEHDRRFRLEHLRGDFFAAVCRQAVQEQRAWLGERHQPSIDLVRRKNPAACVGFGLLAHRRPSVGVDGVRPGYGGCRVAEQPQARSMPRDTGRALDDRVGQLISVRACEV